ncbi:MAG: alpha/beta hydrolase, partial [Anaerolineales bacterium]|nr:alpha/beta hydrolase [Anaerolineales bacterium]
MKAILKILAYLSAINGILLFIRPRDTAVNTLIWIPKMIGAAISPVLGIAGLLGALVGLVKRDWSLSLAGFLGAGLSARFMEEIPDGRDQITSVFGSGQEEPLPKQPAGPVDFQRDLVIGHKPRSGKPFVADLWQPQGDIPRSGLGIIYSHGSGWRVGDKDMLTRPFFRRLAEQGHVVLDIAYSLYPEADLPTMVSEVNHAILWMKENSRTFAINPDRIVLMGGSAGAHLSLLAAYAPGQPEFQPAGENNDTAVRGVVAFYPAADLRDTFAQTQSQVSRTQRPIDKLANAMFNRIFELQPDPDSNSVRAGTEYENYLVNMLGGTLEEIPQVYDLLSPITHVSKDCPATLILQGSDDVFDLAPPVRCLHAALQEAGVPVVLVEYPHT